MLRNLGEAVKLALLILSLGVDTFTVAVALGISGIGRRDRLRSGISFALFEGVMPVVGFTVGRAAGGVLGTVASALGILVLFGVGAWMIYEGLKGEEEATIQVRGWRALALTSLSVSMDELAIGFSMGTLGLPIVPSVVLIAAQAFTLTMVGAAVGNRVGDTVTERGEVLAGIILAALAILLGTEFLRSR